MKNKLSLGLSVRAKIIANSLIMMIMLVLIVITSLYFLSLIGKEIKSIADEDLPLTNALIIAAEHQFEQAILYEKVLRLRALSKDAQSTINHFNEEDQKVTQSIDKTTTLLNKILKVSHSEEATQQFNQLKERLLTVKKIHKDYKKHADQVFSGLESGYTTSVEPLIEKTIHEEELLKSTLKKLVHKIEKFTEKASHTAAKHDQEAFTIIGILSIIAIVISILISWLVSRDILKRLSATVHDVGVVASGDLTSEIMVQGKDEISQVQISIKKMQAQFIKTVSALDASTKQLGGMVQEMSEVMATTDQNISKQKADTEQVATTMNKMTHSVKTVTDSTDAASEEIKAVTNQTTKGRATVGETVDKVKELSDQVESAAQAITEMDEASHNINSVLESIKSIAEQTNLLALNAAIESARAGEQGRGFAVVADEVRKLAGQTQESTMEIHGIMDNFQSGSHKTVKIMNQSQELTKAVVEQVSLADSSLEEIEIAVKKINEMSTDISNAVQEQNTVLKEMNDKTSQIRAASELGDASVEKTAEFKDGLSDISSTLKGLVGSFRVRA
ncbi:chemotaxis protein [Piscirickettsia salmonis]|uniref:methyl-accepting chemotaxis protein n=1 Tax=Piscirickettsia salmonis TaxID=1238 RepID=UPI00094A5FC4|nr:methyl-accepting chemotaxis protein [Piscirickettsia salmonis]APS49663.1 chemotaxis protein [Piscirickettsia salmonis]APS52846.1 chemotaxis protein [Piscirickettsia salmonis]